MQVNMDNQITSMIGLFSAIAGISVSAVGLVITVFVLKRGQVRGTTATGNLKAIFQLLTVIFVLALGPVTSCMLIVARVMQGSLIGDQLFVMQSDDGFVSLFTYGIPTILNALAIAFFIHVYVTQRKLLR